MADEFTIDTSEFDRAIVELGRMPPAVMRRADQAGRANAQTVRDAWRDKVSGNEYAPRAPYSITYDRISGGSESFEYEIGPEKYIGRQGGVVLLLEYGAPRKNLGARGYGLAALIENVDDLERGVQQALVDGARDAGFA